jgi:diadenosine tetraphosphate (Ap4A) HIT family hydrolase
MNDELGQHVCLWMEQVAFSLLLSLLLVGCASSTPKESVDAGDTIAIPAFGRTASAEVLAHDQFFVVIRDKYPVSPGHTLIVARRPAARFQQLTQQERARLLYWIDWTQTYLAEMLSPKPDAFNLGVNDGVAAGQTKEQFHFHIIPRYAGDVPDPRGGVRYVIPSKARYWDNPKEERP